MSEGVLTPISFKIRRPINPTTGEEWDQTGDAARHMRYAHSLNLPELSYRPPRMGRAIVVGGAPSIASELNTIKKLAEDPDNAVFALNFSHNWLLQHGVVPYGCVMFEIDVTPHEFFEVAHPKVTYFICSHCHPKTFDQLEGSKRVLWHMEPNSPAEEEVAKELYPNAHRLGGGIGTFLRTVSIALCLGFRNLDIFGCDSSIPDGAPSTHVDGYPTPNTNDDIFEVVMLDEASGDARKFKTVSYLALQVEEFKQYCRSNHGYYALRVHGDSLLRWVHERLYPHQYEPL